MKNSYITIAVKFRLIHKKVATWREQITSYKPVMVHDFPNLFFLMGANGTSLPSALQTIEAQAIYAEGLAERMKQAEISAVNPKQELVDEFTQNVRDRFKNTTHSKG